MNIYEEKGRENVVCTTEREVGGQREREKLDNRILARNQVESGLVSCKKV